MIYLLDTNVVSELRRSRRSSADARVANWAAGLTANDFFVSAITLEELEIGVLRLEPRDPVQGVGLRSWFENLVLPAFVGRILAVDEAVARRSARLQVPDAQPIRDAFIAGTALVHGLTVATRNVTDFVPMGVPVFNPWLG